jgi:hypothetical protein
MKRLPIIDTSRRVRGEIIGTHRLPKPKFPRVTAVAIVGLTILAVAMIYLSGCASAPGITKTKFMDRARVFDNSWMGKERTPAYRACYPQFFNHLFTECKPIADELNAGEDVDKTEYWQCADNALDLFEACLIGQEVTQ